MVFRWSILRISAEKPDRDRELSRSGATTGRPPTPGRMLDCNRRRANIEAVLIRFIWRFCVSAMPLPIAGMSFRRGCQKCGSGTSVVGFLVQQMITEWPHMSLQPSAPARICSSATFVAFQPTYKGVYMALLGNLLGTVDGLLGTATGAISGGASAGGGASGAVDLSHTLDLGAVIETSPSIDLSTSGLAGTGGIDASVSAPTAIGVSADVGHLDVGGLLHGLV